MIDPTQLATDLALWLAPALPFLKDLGNEAAEAGGKALAGKAWDSLKAAWGKIRGRVEEQPGGTVAVEQAAAAPKDARARGPLEMQLETILKAEPSLADELARLLEAAGDQTQYQGFVSGSGALAQGKGAVAAGAGGIAVGGNFTVERKPGGE